MNVAVLEPSTAVAESMTVELEDFVARVTAYEVIADPPFDAGASQVNINFPLPGVAEIPVTAVGAPIGVTSLLTADAKLVPTSFVAVTAKV